MNSSFVGGPGGAKSAVPERSLDHAAFALPKEFSAPPAEPVLDVSTAAGLLLLPHGDRMITRVLSEEGVWEGVETSWLLATLRPGHTFVDVGAHVGYFSVLASKLVGGAGAVIAIEPEARNVDLLRRNLVRNGCTNSIVVPFAAHSRGGWMSLALDEENRGGHRLVMPGETSTIVQCVRLDDVLPRKVDLVKIDAQGYDHEIVEGLEWDADREPGVTVGRRTLANGARA